MRKELQDLKIHIYEDGKIDDKEVEILRSVLAHYGLGEEEARLLMDLNTPKYRKMLKDFLGVPPSWVTNDTCFISAWVRKIGNNTNKRFVLVALEFELTT